MEGVIASNKGFQIVEALSIRIPGFEQHKFFVHQNPATERWIVTEKTTGAAISAFGNDTLGSAVIAAQKRLKAASIPVEEARLKFIKEKGLAPTPRELREAEKIESETVPSPVGSVGFP